jgi:hypothetical protein
MCRLNVSLLAGLIAAAQHDEPVLPLGVVHAVAGSEIHLQFTDAARQSSMPSGISMRESVHSELNARPRSDIPYGVEPILIDGRKPGLQRL